LLFSSSHFGRSFQLQAPSQPRTSIWKKSSSGLSNTPGVFVASEGVNFYNSTKPTMSVHGAVGQRVQEMWWNAEQEQAQA
jgi:hypothetical protein